MEALISQIPKSLKAPRNSRSSPAMPGELCPEGSDQLSPSLIPLDRVPAGVCQESHQTIVPCSLPQHSRIVFQPETPSLRIPGDRQVTAHPPGLHTAQLPAALPKENSTGKSWELGRKAQAVPRVHSFDLSCYLILCSH